MVKIQLGGRYGHPIRGWMLVDDEDADLAAFKWSSRGGYGIRMVGYWKDNKFARAHRVIVERMLGRPLGLGEEVDHANCIPSDNRRCNLRVVTRLQQCQNRAKARQDRRNKSGYRNVHRSVHTASWSVQIMVNRKRHTRGGFATPEAANAYACGMRKTLGVFGE